MSWTTKTPTLVFDWGDTLMKVFPQYQGVMASWPEVAAVDGVRDTLERLHKRFTMLVASNASDLNQQQIRAALKRVGLGDLIETVYTFNELGARKPDPDFFHQIEAIRARPDEMYVMVGDEFIADVCGAWQVGWPVIWFNPLKKAAPGLYPAQTAEITQFTLLEVVLDQIPLPDINQCISWLVEAGASANLLAHVQAVAAAAYQMAIWMRAAGRPVDPLLAHRGGLLHDLAKLTPTSQENRDLHHGERAARMLEERKQPALAEIARRHMMDCLLDPRLAPQSAEEKLVYLADKLLEGSRVVSFAERMDGLRIRYPQHAGTFEQAVPAVLQLQAEIAAAAGLSVESLVTELGQTLKVCRRTRHQGLFSSQVEIVIYRAG